MAEYYLDFETTGIDPLKDKIITIQYQRLSGKTGQAISSLEILKEWESSEKKILLEFLRFFGPESGIWDFIPIGFNLRFEFAFLLIRASEVLDIELPFLWLFYDKPQLDIKSTIVMINKGLFKGSKLSWFTRKEDHGYLIPNWYKQKEYHNIEEYIVKETKEFIEAYQFLKKHLPPLYDKYQSTL